MKLEAGFTYADLIKKLEIIKKKNVKLTYFDNLKFSDLPVEAYEALGNGVSQWGGDTLLNTSKWKPVDVPIGKCNIDASCECPQEYTTLEQFHETSNIM